MGDDISTKSSESSITTSGEYEIVTDSNITTPLGTQPSLDIVNNSNISDLQFAMNDALKEFSADKHCEAIRAVDTTLVTSNESLDLANATNNITKATVSLENNNCVQGLQLPLQTIPPKNQKMTSLAIQTENLLNENGDSSYLSKNEQSKRLKSQAQKIEVAVSTPNLSTSFKCLNSNSDFRSIGKSMFYGHHYVNTNANESCNKVLLNQHHHHSKGAIDDVEQKNRTEDSTNGNNVSKFSKIKDQTDFNNLHKKYGKAEEEVSEIDQCCTIFSGVTYLGAANINAPKSELDVYRIMSELSSGSSSEGLKISISIPNCSDGLVVLHDIENKSIIATYEIQSIILFFRGPIETVENGCFAFTWLHGDNLFQCHVFRCNISEAVNQVSACFQKAFQKYPPSMSCCLNSAYNSNMINSITSDISGNPINTAGYEFCVSLEIREKMAKNTFSPVPRDRNGFRLRANTDKEVYIIVKQLPSNVLQPLFIERCFGVLLSHGKLVRQGDMQLIDMISMGYQQQNQQQQYLNSTSNNSNNDGPVMITAVAPLNSYYIHAEWKSTDKAFEQLNVEMSKTFLTVAVDIVIRGIQEPVRFLIETPITIQPATELRIMDHFISKRPMTLRFYLHLKRTSEEYSWKVSSIDPSEEIVEQSSAISSSSSYLLKFGMNNLSRIVRSSSVASIEDECCAVTDLEDLSDADEPLLSGTGEVSKDCSQDTLDEWDPILKEWDGNTRPKNLANLVRQGVPEALREKIWQKLAGIESKPEMNDMYKILITKETKCETVIQRDIHRTFPAHRCFRECGGSGQDSLFKVSKAYAVYDSEVGYCQGLSFIAASLLLHMPEEDAFAMLVSLMYDYGLRDMYKKGFEVLYLRLYQLERLIKNQLPKLYEHFVLNGIETHMYASQWFLTLFTARFPLYFVFHVLDVFLLDGISLLFQVAITLLAVCENDLRELDFEGILKYFRVLLPKKCRSPSQAQRIMKMACERKVKKLKQYEAEFIAKKQDKERLEKEAQIYENRFGEEKLKMRAEVDDLQRKLSEANDRAVTTESKHTSIIQDYKQIIQRMEQDIFNLNERLQIAMNTILKCTNCSKIMGNNKKISSPDTVESQSMKDNQLLNNQSENILITTDPLHSALNRIRELELDLAQAKLAQVEAECKNQDLNHQLTTTITEMQANRSTWHPWLSKTFNTLQEKVVIRNNQSTFQSYVPPTFNESSSPKDQQEFNMLPANSSKLPTKFLSSCLRNSIDTIRNNTQTVAMNNWEKFSLQQ